MLQELYNNKDYKRVTKTAQIVINAMNKVETTQPKVLPKKLKLQLLVGKAKFHAGNYSDGLEDIEYVLETILGLPAEMFDEEDKMNACWELFPRIVYAEACYNIKATTFQAIISHTVLFFFGPRIHLLTTSASNFLQDLSKSHVELSHATELVCTTAEFNRFHYISHTDFYTIWQRMMYVSKSTILMIPRALLHLCVLQLQLLINFTNKFCIILEILASWNLLMMFYNFYRLTQDHYLFTLFIADVFAICYVILASLRILCLTLLKLVIAPRRSGTLLLSLLSNIQHILCKAEDPRFMYGILCPIHLLQ